MCPVCRTALTSDQVFPDTAVKREIFDLQVMCDTVREGCTWKGELRTLKDHIAECQCATVPCSSCGAHVMRRYMSNHLKMACSERETSCYRCQKSFRFLDMKKHRSECPQFPLRCPQGCGKFVARSKMSSHVAAKGQCPNTPLPCPFFNAGCKFIGKRKDIAQHQEDELENHLTLCHVKMKKSEKKITYLEDRIQDLEDENGCLKDEITDLKARVFCRKEGSDSVTCGK